MPAEYKLGSIKLTIQKEAYLILIRVNEAPGKDSVNALPEWIFRSSHAIWLMEGNQPIIQRAKAGEKIKRQLMSERKSSLHAAS